MKYCSDIKCIQDHCKYGANGIKKAHVAECPELHCYTCFKHNVLELDNRGLVKSFYCNDCSKDQIQTPIGKPRTVKEMQAKLKQLKGKPLEPMGYTDEEIKEIEVILGAPTFPYKND